MIQNLNPDKWGMLASGLCLIHCAITPFVFIAKACTVTCCAAADLPLWWKMIDFLFIAVSFIAIYFATKTSSIGWLKMALWTAWLVLCLIILNESLQKIILPAWSIYFPALAIVGLHFYNYRYCSCAGDGCWVEG